MQLADALQINGTPTFVVGQDLVVGAVGYDQLKDKVDSVHKCGRADLLRRCPPAARRAESL